MNQYQAGHLGASVKTHSCEQLSLGCPVVVLYSAVLLVPYMSCESSESRISWLPQTSRHVTSRHVTSRPVVTELEPVQMSGTDWPV